MMWYTVRCTGCEGLLGVGTVCDTCVPGDHVPLRAVKYASVLPISAELLMDEGIITDTRPSVTMTRTHRVRWAYHNWLHNTRMKIASFVAGFDVEDRDG